ncbi:MAG: MJ1477/TM1410 family putative glycoside hydrolase [Chloroflexota bacterium]|nr:MJ1477/TM1410 family putative glycoside hydrolase [Chloroflexota bacterium]
MDSKVLQRLLAALSLFLLMGLVASCSTDFSAADEVPPPPATQEPNGTAPAALAGGDKWELWTHGTQLRGANIYQRRVYPEIDGVTFMGDGPVGPPYTQADFDRLAARGANYVNLSHPGIFSETPPYVVDADIQANLDRLLALAAQADLFAVISFRTGPGRAEFSVCCLDDAGDWYDGSYLHDSVWQDQAAQDAWAAMWRYTAARYRDNPVVVGYDLMVEPNSNEVGADAVHAPLDVWNPEDFYATYGGTLYDWNQLYPRITTAIREVDTETPLLIGGLSYSAVNWLPYLAPTGDPRTVYTAHQYEPFKYTHQDWDALECTYPGTCDLDGDGEAEPFERDWLAGLWQTLATFQQTHGVPVAVNEFGLMRWEPGAAAFMDDELDLLEQQGVNYALWVWESSWEPFAEEVTAFNFRYGPDLASRADVETSALQTVIYEYWGRNTVRPSSWSTSYLPVITNSFSTASARLEEVDDFLYQLQGLDLDAIGATAYDLVVMDYSADGAAEGEFTAAQIDALQHSAGGEKIVLAYMSIGEAEDYRFYWQGDWEPGSPAWLDVGNPAWEGNYKVRYWNPEWQEIIFAYTDRLVDAGFDGAYLDIIDAYEYYAEQGRSATAQEMADFVAAIRAHARARDPDFFIFPQNAAELVELAPGYLQSVDGIGQEDIYYGYEDDDALTPPEVSAALEENLDRFLESGKLVLTTDYATTPSHVDDAYAKSRARGYVSFVTVRALDRLTINLGHAPD